MTVLHAWTQRRARPKGHLFYLVHTGLRLIKRVKISKYFNRNKHQDMLTLKLVSQLNFIL